MLKFGDVEFHRKLLSEFQNSKARWYIQAAIMSSLGSPEGMRSLQDVPGLLENPSLIMRAQITLLRQTLLLCQGGSSFADTSEEVTSRIQEVTELLQQPLRESLGGHVSSYASLASVVISPGLNSRAVGSFDTNSEDDTSPSLSPEAVADVSAYWVAYNNFLSGFAVLWEELFGDNYDFLDDTVWTTDAGGAGGCSCKQFPAHLYMVCWENVLSAERKGWFREMETATQDLLCSIVLREVPPSLYFLFILYVHLFVRAQLLMTIAELFVWSSNYCDVGYCMHQIYACVQSQREVIALHRLYREMGFLSEDFENECSLFAKDVGYQLRLAEGYATAVPSRYNSRSSTPARSPVQRVPPTVISPLLPRRNGSTFNLQSPLNGSDEAHQNVREMFASMTSAGNGGAVGEPDSVASGTRPASSGTPSRDSRSGLTSPLNSARRRDKVHLRSIFNPMYQAGAHHDDSRRKIQSQCRFLWLLQHMFSELNGRCSLLFGRCLKTSCQTTRQSFQSGGMMLDSAKSAPGAKRRTHDGTEMLSREDTASLEEPASRLREVPSFVVEETVHDTAAATAAVPTTTHAHQQHHHEIAGTALGKRTPRWEEEATSDPLHVSPLPELSPAPAVSSVDNDFFFYSEEDEAEAKKKREEGCHEDGVYNALTLPLHPELLLLQQRYGCTCLARGIQSALQHSVYTTTFIILTNNTTRPGKRCWRDHELALWAEADDPTTRAGLQPWVLNHVCPSHRLASPAAASAAALQRETVALDERCGAAQRDFLLRYLVFQLAGRTTQKVSFATPRSLFYSYAGGPQVDANRLYFVLHFQLPPTKEGLQDGTAALDRVLHEEERWAYNALERIWLLWVMGGASNEAVRLGYTFAAARDTAASAASQPNKA